MFSFRALFLKYLLLRKITFRKTLVWFSTNWHGTGNLSFTILSYVCREAKEMRHYSSLQISEDSWCHISFTLQYIMGCVPWQPPLYLLEFFIGTVHTLAAYVLDWWIFGGQLFLFCWTHYCQFDFWPVLICICVPWRHGGAESRISDQYCRVKVKYSSQLKYSFGCR